MGEILKEVGKVQSVYSRNTKMENKYRFLRHQTTIYSKGLYNTFRKLSTLPLRRKKASKTCREGT